MERLYKFIAFIGLLGTMLPAWSQTVGEEVTSEAPSDSTIAVIAYFEKNDTVKYSLETSVWELISSDTIMHWCKTTNFNIIVVDSLPSSYKMQCVFTDFVYEPEGVLDDAKLFSMSLAELVGKNLIGLSIDFETDEFGAITKIFNLDQVKHSLATRIKKGVKDMFKQPEVARYAKKCNLDPELVDANHFADESADGLKELLDLIFAYHGKELPMGELNMHEEASDEEYENDSYLFVDQNPNTGSYIVEADVKYTIPPTTPIPFGSVTIDSDNENKELADALLNMLNAANAPTIRDAYYCAKYLYMGWPYEIIRQVSETTQGKGTSTQITITME